MRIFTFSYHFHHSSTQNVANPFELCAKLFKTRKLVCLSFLFIALLFSLLITIKGQTESKQQMISRLTTELQTGNENVQLEAADDLAIAGKDALPVLIATLKSNKSRAVQVQIVKTICNIDTDALPALVSLLKENLNPQDDITLRHGANAVACIAEASNQDNSNLAEIVPILIDKLERSRDTNKAAMAIFNSSTKPTAEQISQVNSLMEGFDAAAHCLGRIGRQSKKALPLLFEIAGTEANRRDGYTKIDSISFILTDLIKISDISANSEINKAFAENRDKLADKDRRLLERRISALNTIEAAQKQYIRSLFWNYGIYLLPLLILLIVWFAFYIFKPIWLLEIYEVFRLEELRMKSVVGAVTIPLEYISSKILLRPRILDAWVTKYLPEARENFSKIATVKDRSVYVPVGLFINGQLEPEINAENLQAVFNHNQSRIVISGVGGAGKTSLACKILQWGMSDEKSDRLIPDHAMLPVLLEGDFVNKGDDALSKAISSQLSNILDMESPISNGLLHTLLKTKRILVLVDGFSEMDDPTREAIHSGISKIPVNAIIITSRLEEHLNQLKHTLILPTKIKGNQLSSFVESYLTSLNKKHLFEDEEFFEGCRMLTTIVGDRDITALLAKLFVDQMIAKQEKTLDEKLPKNILELMLKSIEILFKKRASEELPLRDVIKTIVIIAWESLKKDFRPRPVAYDDLKKALSQQDNGEKCLEYIRDRLKLIEDTSFDQKIKFKIDPLAEYLAADHLVKQNRDNQGKWHSFFEHISFSAQSPQNIKGFLLAVLDCCKINEELNVPESVITKLTGLIEST